MFYTYIFATTSVSQEDEFSEVTRERKKRKAISSPTLPALQKPSSSEHPPETLVRPRPSLKNTIPVIISGVDDKIKTWRQLMGKLRQYHPSLKVSSIKALPEGDFVIVRDSLQHVTILQSETKMKAALGQKVKISLPKAYQINKIPTKSLVVKGVPTDITVSEFNEFLNLNKISYAKAERLKSEKYGRVLPIFQLETTNPAKAEALLSQNLACDVTGIVYKVEEFRAPISVMQCYNCQCFGHSAETCRSKQKSLICGENHSHKGCPSRESRKPNVQIVTDHMLLLTKGVWNTKAGVQTTCGQQSKIICLSSKPKHSLTAKTQSDLNFYSRTSH